jgi:HB1, ASXL, restriction endonuclease HTH domain
MKKDEVKVGGTYAVKVSDKVVPVRIEAESPHGGWVGTNQETGKQVRIKSVQRLRGEWPKGSKAVVAPGAPAGPEKPLPTEAPGRAPGDAAPQVEQPAKQKKARAPRAKEGAEEGGLSGLDAAARVLEEAGEPLSCKAIVERAFAKGYWRSDGKTPAATIYAAVLREVQKKGDQARFRKAARGKFDLAR